MTHDLLVLDDDHDSADLLASVLKLHFPDAKFRVVYSGESAVQAAESHMPSTAIFDLAMVGIGGEKAARLIRAMLGGESCTFVALSESVGSLGNLTGGLPFDHAFSKPADIQAVVSLLKRLPDAQPAK
ncbi:hypothetical protein [Variovorax sp. RHLX14]|uniref:hypothetical protein n=1 Tax=Variovorax sp. RHLX14 TaxID=1259731 RepID=UPI003F499479